MPPASFTLIAVDIGNSRIKLGRFARTDFGAALPTPGATLELPLANPTGEFDAGPLATWCKDHAAADAIWRVSSVHRGAAARFNTSVCELARDQSRHWIVRPVTLADVPLAIEIDAPEKVGMDRLMGAVAANRLRAAGNAALVADLGTALKLQAVNAAGAFIGGAILPGLAMAARALQEQTDALPLVEAGPWRTPPPAIGKSTRAAIESGLFWGAVGAIQELVRRSSLELPPAIELFVTGGGSQLFADVLSDEKGLAVRHVPHLVLSGIALVDAGGK